MTDEAMSPLRRRMIEDMTIRKLAPKTQHDYVQRVKNFAAFLRRSPDTATFEDVRRYQLHLTASGVGAPTINQTVSTLRFFFRVTLKRHEIVDHTHVIHEPRKLPVVLSVEEVARLLDAAPGAQIQGGAERGLRCRAACQRGRLAQGLRYRQQADDHPRRAGQGRQGPQCHAVAQPARAATGLVEDGSAARLAVPWP
ncbi:integrase [Bradyrhizobium embrapense]